MNRKALPALLLATAFTLPAQTEPGPVQEEQIKLLAIETLMHTGSDRALGALEKMIAASGTSPKIRQRAVRAIAMNRSSQAQETLARIYSGATTDESVKRETLRGWMAAGNRDALLKAAREERSIPLRREAVRLLGASGAADQLAGIYANETTPEIREEALRSMAAHGQTALLLEAVKAEKDPAMREKALRYVGHVRTPATEQALLELYGSSGDTGSRRAILRALMQQGNAKPLIALARKETSPELRTEAVRCLAHMKSAEATDFLMELLTQ